MLNLFLETFCMRPSYLWISWFELHFPQFSKLLLKYPSWGFWTIFLIIILYSHTGKADNVSSNKVTFFQIWKLPPSWWRGCEWKLNNQSVICKLWDRSQNSSSSKCLVESNEEKVSGDGQSEQIFGLHKKSSSCSDYAWPQSLFYDSRGMIWTTTCWDDSPFS